jgi:hypothetical protein
MSSISEQAKIATTIELSSGRWGNNPQVPKSAPKPTGPEVIDFRYESQLKFASHNVKNLNADLIKTRRGQRAGYRVTFPAEFLPADPVNFNHFICAPIVQGENPGHYLSYLNDPIWQYGIGVLAARGGMAFELWTGNSTAAVWSDSGYFARSGIHQVDGTNDPNSPVKHYTGPVISYRRGFKGLFPNRGNLTLACEIINVGTLPGTGSTQWLLAFAWVSDDPENWLTWGQMYIPVTHIVSGLALRQVAAKTVAGQFEALVELSYYASPQDLIT